VGAGRAAVRGAGVLYHQADVALPFVLYLRVKAQYHKVGRSEI
jgi:hypothetical protein